MNDLNRLGQIFEGQALQSIANRYKSNQDLDFNEVTDKLVEVLSIANAMGKQLKHYFVSYSPGFVQVDPFFFYFDEEIDLKAFLYKRNSHHRPSKIKVYWNVDDQRVVSIGDDGEEWIIGFVKQTKDLRG